MGGILEQRVNTLPPDDLASLAATYAACATPYTPPSSSSSSSSSAASAAPINSSASTRRLLGLVTKAAQDKIDLFKPTDFAELVWGIATHEAAVLALPTASELREPWQATHAFMKAAGGVVSETASRLKPSLFVAMVCAVATVTAECCAPFMRAAVEELEGRFCTALRDARKEDEEQGSSAADGEARMSGFTGTQLVQTMCAVTRASFTLPRAPEGAARRAPVPTKLFEAVSGKLEAGGGGGGAAAAVTPSSLGETEVASLAWAFATANVDAPALLDRAAALVRDLGAGTDGKESDDEGEIVEDGSDKAPPLVRDVEGLSALAWALAAMGRGDAEVLTALAKAFVDAAPPVPNGGANGGGEDGEIDATNVDLDEDLPPVPAGKGAAAARAAKAARAARAAVAAAKEAAPARPIPPCGAPMATSTTTRSVKAARTRRCSPRFGFRRTPAPPSECPSRSSAKRRTWRGRSPPPMCAATSPSFARCTRSYLASSPSLVPTSSRRRAPPTAA